MSPTDDDAKPTTVEMPPGTPSRQGALLDQASTRPSTDSSKGRADSFLTISDGDKIAQRHAFLAYARRVRSFSSPLKINRSRYLLTFLDADAAQAWWKLMQDVYPDSVRESPQLFSFKSDRVPALAWDNPRFAHLKDRWTYRQLDDKENYPSGDIDTAGQEKSNIAQKRAGKRRSVMRILSSPALGTIGEAPPIAGARNAHIPGHDDPFVQLSPPISNSFNVSELNQTLDRMQMMMNQTNLRIDAMAEKQQMYAESIDRLQQALESSVMQIQAMTAHAQAGGITTKNMRSAIEQNASHVRAILERQAHDADRLERIDVRLKDGFRCVDGLVEKQMTNLLEKQNATSSSEPTGEKIQAIYDKQSSHDEKLDAIMISLEQLPTIHLPSMGSPAPNPSAEDIQRLQVAVEQQQTQLAGLISSQKASNDMVANIQKSMEIESNHGDTLARRLDDLQAAYTKQITKLKRNMTKLMDEKMEKLLAAQTEYHDRTIKALTAKPTQPTQNIRRCDHDVAPPPRKMNKELAGYWYKRNE